MPECPVCHQPYQEGLPICEMCGAITVSPPDVCPRCGVRVAPAQMFCANCHAPLETANPLASSTLRLPEPPGRSRAIMAHHLWIHGFLVALVLVTLISVGVSLLRRPSPPPGGSPEETKPALAVSPSAPSLSPSATEKPSATIPSGTRETGPNLKAQLEETLTELREASLHQDLNRFMGLYAPTFPRREHKRQETLKIWEAYQHIGLDYQINQIKVLDPSRAWARITWTVISREKNTGTIQNVARAYEVVFVRDLGKWRIQSSERAG
ncbi:MAG: zinc ribbon domain-containing protein [Deltaproteobacteria bacterium]|nr:zinc ribbon domain-containing protein [Deltaproteobacteria bacterium]